jgi:hypothetical protein
MDIGFNGQRILNSNSLKLKKGVKYGCEEDFDDRGGFCGGL